MLVALFAKVEVFSRRKTFSVAHNCIGKQDLKPAALVERKSMNLKPFVHIVVFLTFMTTTNIN